MGSLVIVESPAKGKTIEKYLGAGFKVMASYGHVRDLVPKEGAVDPEDNFAMRYELIERNKRHVDAIRKALGRCDTLLLATDPDREGEAISWHLVELLRDAGELEGKVVQRVVFHEITKRAIQEAVAQPRDIAYDLVNAQQARRALDYLVGFNLSPLLWKKIKRGLSAGRVQSPALRLISEREDEIEKFEPREYWSVDAKIGHDTPFSAKLHTLEGERVKQFTVNNTELAHSVRERLIAAANGSLQVNNIEKKQRRRNPQAPFTTSTLQQEGVRKLGFSASRTMRIAQQLYEGVDIGEGAVGLITYMRTDSVSLSQEAIEDVRHTISSHYGDKLLPKQPNVYKTKSKNAQEAHEAVRPTSAQRRPVDLKSFLSSDQFRLYELIWKRTVASQMLPAIYDQVAADLLCGGAQDMFRATGSTLRFPGYLSVYREGIDDEPSDDDERKLPPLEVGQQLPLEDIALGQHFTEPPPRFTEATLVKALEEFGIGRPSTYASIISTLQSREYVEMDGRRFIPTDTGRVVNRFLSKHFEQYVDYTFTARLEDDLDAVARGEKAWTPLLDGFWQPFNALIVDKEASVSRDEAIQSRELGTDPKTGRPVSARLGRYGPIIQIGSREDEEKPLFASLLPGQRIDTIALEEALTLFRLPRHLGESADGEKISVSIGRFGPYVKFGSSFASMKEGDPYTITLEAALDIVAEKKRADAERIVKLFDGTSIQILNGRWGPYITDGKKNAKIPKERKEEAAGITLEEATTWLSEAPEKKKRAPARRKKT